MHTRKARKESVHEYTSEQFVCTGGSPTRLKLYAEWFSKECNIECSENLSKSDRFVLYKTGKVVWVN
ncbi:hypothetical protein ANCDUO_22477, partial [Ancylostoma duodenale]